MGGLAEGQEVLLMTGRLEEVYRRLQPGGRLPTSIIGMSLPGCGCRDIGETGLA